MVRLRTIIAGLSIATLAAIGVKYSYDFAYEKGFDAASCVFSPQKIRVGREPSGSFRSAYYVNKDESSSKEFVFEREENGELYFLLKKD